MASSPPGWPPSGPRRPETTRQKPAASITISSARAVAPAPAGGAGEFESVGLAVAAGPLRYDVGDDDTVVVSGKHQFLTRCTSEI